MTIINRPYIQLSENETVIIQEFINIMEEIAKQGADDMSDWASHLSTEICDFFSEYEA